MKRLIYCILSLLMLACTDEIPMVNLGIDEVYYISRMSKLPLHPALTGASYSWKVDGAEVSTARDYIFMAAQEGVYSLSLDIIDSATPYHHEFEVYVVHEEVEYSPYIEAVYEYCPAPGQFINTMPQYEEGDTYADMLRKCTESLSGTNDVLVSLGGFGGYITFGFDHTVINRAGEKDFRIWGNSFYDASHTDMVGGSSEPGVVMVSLDVNCNGLPDDPWYEIAGSEYSNPATIHNYEITYYRPDPQREVVKDAAACITDKYYIAWKDNQGVQGYMPKNTFHSQDYYPYWVEADEIILRGTRLPDNAIDISGRGTYYFQNAFAWGYADNHPNDEAELCSYDISWAVNEYGMPVNLPGIDFVRVYTGENQYCGWIGETSTEITRAADLHIDSELQIKNNIRAYR
ncbi:MAG: cell surface protein [Muribaculaceae bacterium]